MEISIRKAQREDCGRLLELVRELAAYVNGAEEVTISDEHFVESGFGVQPIWSAFVATTGNGNIVGFALYYIRFSTWKGQRMYLEDILVTSDMRGKGVGKLLFEALIAEASALGLHGINWQVLSWNKAAINFYEKYHTQFENDWLNCGIKL